MAINFFFWLFASLAFLFSIGVVTSRSPMHSAISLVLTLINLAGLFLVLHAEFLAWILIIVYTGAVMVLIIFVISLLNLQRDEPIALTTPRRWGVFAALLFLGTFFVYLYRDPMVGFSFPVLLQAPEAWGAVESVAEAFFVRYLLPFELASILLTAAVIGALLVARRPAEDNQEKTNQ